MSCVREKATHLEGRAMGGRPGKNAGIRRFGRERGAVAIIVGLSIAVLVGFAGLALDLGHLYVTKTELQDAADACALAAARELTCDPSGGTCSSTYLERAENAGIAVAARNKVGFQASAVVIDPADVRFSVTFTPNSAYSPRATADPASRYVMCIARRTGIATWFMQVLGQGEQTVASYAVATLAPSQTNCAIPLGLCTVPGGTAPNFGLIVSNWYSTKFTPGRDPSSTDPKLNPTGNFNWIDFDPGNPTPGCSGGGSAELACIMKGSGQCNLPPVGPATCPSGSSPPPGCVGQTGENNSLADAYNNRFGLYRGGGVASTDLTSSPPDYTGYEYTPSNWPALRDAYGGTSGSEPNFSSARASNRAYEGSQLGGFKSASSSQLQSYGADRRVTVVPIVDCPAYTPGQTVPILGYACVLLLNPFNNPGDDVRIEYLGRSDIPGSPCATSGSVGGPGSSGPLVPALVQ